MRPRAILSLLLVFACASTPTYQRSPDQEQKWAVDDYECTQESRTAWSGGGAGVALFYVLAQRTATKLYTKCMRARGWEPEPEG